MLIQTAAFFIFICRLGNIVPQVLLYFVQVGAHSFFCAFPVPILYGLHKRIMLADCWQMKILLALNTLQTICTVWSAWVRLFLGKPLSTALMNSSWEHCLWVPVLRLEPQSICLHRCSTKSRKPFSAAIWPRRTIGSMPLTCG